MTPKKKPQTDPRAYKRAIVASGLTIYDPIEVGDPNLWIPTAELERLLDDHLRGESLAGLPLRTRSKVAKQLVCVALGYPVPKSFQRTQPRFVGQNLDTYVQKSDNLQIWNEELAPIRRYAIVRVNEQDKIARVKVVTGESLAKLDTTGTLTQKYQARCEVGDTPHELVSHRDTDRLRPFVSADWTAADEASPIGYPTAGELLPIAVIYERLKPLLGRRFTDIGIDQERNRGAALHRLVCTALGYASYHDDGQFPDVKHQLTEVKLQTSPTIDLGLVLPDSTEPLDVPQVDGQVLRHCDVRYAVFYGQTDGQEVTLTHLILTTGETFFTRFQQFQGRVLNKKLQIPLPSDFFDG